MKRNNSGFTLIELLVVMAILSILCGLGLGASRVYRQRSYAALVYSSSHNAWTALEASVSDLDNAPAGWYGGWTNVPGPVTGWDGEPFLPGYINPKGISINAFYNSWCSANPGFWCMERGINIHHCKSGKMMWWFKLSDGTELKNEWEGMPWC